METKKLNDLLGEVIENQTDVTKLKEIVDAWECAYYIILKIFEKFDISSLKMEEIKKEVEKIAEESFMKGEYFNNQANVIRLKKSALCWKRATNYVLLESAKYKKLTDSDFDQIAQRIKGLF